MLTASDLRDCLLYFHYICSVQMLSYTKFEHVGSFSVPSDDPQAVM